MNKFQFTFFTEKGYKPVACVLNTDKNFIEIIKEESDFRNQAIIKICQKRGWTVKDFTGYGYKKFKYKRIKE